MNNEDFACTVATLMLVDDDIAITSEKIMAILKAANVEIEPIWPKIFAEKLGPNVKDLITNVSCSAGAAAPVAAAQAAGAPAAAQAAEAKEEKKEEKEEEEEDDDMGFGLFD